MKIIKSRNLLTDNLKNFRIWNGNGYERKLIYGAASDLYDHELNTEGALVASMLKGPDGLISLTSYVGAPITAYQNFNPHGDTTLISLELELTRFR